MVYHLQMRRINKKRKGINYNREVAFEHKAPAGFYDTGEEQMTSKEMGKKFRPVTLEEMEGKRRKASFCHAMTLSSLS